MGSHQPVLCANHDRSMFVLRMIETTSRGSFNYDQMKWQAGGDQASAQKIQNWAYCETICLVEIWADVTKQRQFLAIG